MLITDRITPALAAVELLDAAGKPRRLGTLWEERPVVLAFLRHFG